MTDEPLICASGETHCITCGDEGIPMTVVEITDGTAICRDGEDARHEVAADLVGPVRSGDQILVHAGVAIALLEEAR
jgi:hydrogenase assembly chaperone HypC/HupF